MKHIHNESGIALLMTLLVMLLFSILGLSIIGLNVNNAKQINARESLVTATDMAEMGLTIFDSDFNELIVNTNATSVSEIFNNIHSTYNRFPPQQIDSHNGFILLPTKEIKKDEVIKITSIGLSCKSSELILNSTQNQSKCKDNNEEVITKKLEMYKQLTGKLDNYNPTSFPYAIHSDGEIKLDKKGSNGGIIINGDLQTNKLSLKINEDNSFENEEDGTITFDKVYYKDEVKLKEKDANIDMDKFIKIDEYNPSPSSFPNGPSHPNNSYPTTANTSGFTVEKTKISISSDSTSYTRTDNISFEKGLGITSSAANSLNGIVYSKDTILMEDRGNASFSDDVYADKLSIKDNANAIFNKVVFTNGLEIDDNSNVTFDGQVVVDDSIKINDNKQGKTTVIFNGDVFLNKEITIKGNSHVIFNGQVSAKEIKIDGNARVEFHDAVYVEELEIKNSTSLLFSEKVVVHKKITIKDKNDEEDGGNFHLDVHFKETVYTSEFKIDEKNKNILNITFDKELISTNKVEIKVKGDGEILFNKNLTSPSKVQFDIETSVSY